MTLTAAPAAPPPPVDIVAAAQLSGEDVLARLGVDGRGLSDDEAARRRTTYGPNAVASHHARALPVLWHQLRSPLLALLVAAAVASFFVGERSSAVIIGVIVALSVGLGFAPLPGLFFAALAVMVIGYLLLIEVGKKLFYRPRAVPTAAVPHRHPAEEAPCTPRTSSSRAPMPAPNSN